MIPVSEEVGMEVKELQRRQRGSPARALASRMLMKYGGLTQRAVAPLMGLGTGAAVSIQVRKLAELAASDRRLRKQIARLDRRLAGQPGQNAQRDTLVNLSFKG